MQSYKRVYAEISLDAIKHNMAEIKEHVGNDTKVMAIIKADGYGHGAVAVAKAIDAMADYYGVAILEEAIELRKNGIDKPLLILGYTSPRQYADLVLHNVTQTIFDFETAKKLSETACSLNMTANIHIAIDTGMNRIGFKAEKESLNTIKQIYSLPNIFIEGIFTHFATADEKDKTFANEQYSKILDRMRVLSTKYASEAFEDNDSLRLAYGAMIFNACRETCLPLYMEAYREYCNY